MEETFITEEKIPLVIKPTKKSSFKDLLAYIDDNQESLKEKVLQHGGILLRGFPVDGADDFNQVVEHLGFGQALNYIGGDSPRDQVKEKVYTSTEAPPGLKIPLHNEMSFIKDYPKHIYFHCQIPAKRGGATILGDARAIYHAIRPDVRERFTEKGLRYVSNYYQDSKLMSFVNKIQRGHKTWMEVFETEDKKEVEEKCSLSDFGYRWHKKNWLEISQERPSIMNHPKTEEKIWFNQAHLYDYNPKLIGFWNWLGTKFVYFRKHTIMHQIQYGDGTPLPKKDLYHVMDVLDQKTISFPWQKGDVMALDNVTLMHGRAPFSGKRRILTALTR